MDGRMQSYIGQYEICGIDSNSPSAFQEMSMPFPQALTKPGTSAGHFICIEGKAPTYYSYRLKAP